MEPCERISALFLPLSSTSQTYLVNRTYNVRNMLRCATRRSVGLGFGLRFIAAIARSGGHVERIRQVNLHIGKSIDRSNRKGVMQARKGLCT